VDRSATTDAARRSVLEPCGGSKHWQGHALVEPCAGWLTFHAIRCRPFAFIEELHPMSSITVTHIQPIVALIAGVLILIMPRLLNFIVAIYLILIGIIGLGIIR
jgi:hypothetical protein